VWEHFPPQIELFLLCFFTSFPLLPLFLKKKKNSDSTQLLPHSLFLQTPSKALKNSEDNNKR
jgi:hypothetical protein